MTILPGIHSVAPGNISAASNCVPEMRNCMSLGPATQPSQSPYGLRIHKHRMAPEEREMLVKQIFKASEVLNRQVSEERKESNNPSEFQNQIIKKTIC